MSNRYKGGVISATPPTLVAGAGASGTWTLEQQMQATAAGLWPVNGPFFIEDVFSTYLYTGNGSTQTITNGIDLAGKGGLVWAKIRDQAFYHGLSGPDFATSYFGGYGGLRSNQTAALGGTDFTGVTSTGYTLGYIGGDMNFNAGSYVSWTFRKQPKFFDVVTYTGNGVAGREIPHNLGSVPGCIILKSTSAAGVNWNVFHRSIAPTGTLRLNLTDAQTTNFIEYYFGNDTAYVAPTSTVFTVGGSSAGNQVNGSGQTYVAYLFAHDAGGFGLTGTDNVISCGSFTTDGSGNATVNLGYEPQWVMIKSSDLSNNWIIGDNMRGAPAAGGGGGAALAPNLSNAEFTSASAYPYLTNATGFSYNSNCFGAASSGVANYIYIAIRRGPMKVPTSGASVFAPTTYTGTGSVRSVTGLGFPPDMVMLDSKSFANNFTYDKLRGSNIRLFTNDSAAEVNDSNRLTSFDQNGFSLGILNPNESGVSYANWNFRRAPNFFDEVCYTGTGANTNFNHNLGVAPELMIVKSRSGNFNWQVYSSSVGATAALRLNTTGSPVTSNAWWNDTSPTASVFTIGTAPANNNTGDTYVAYLFATCAGVSKVGSYTGTGTTLQVNCGFTSGARFVLIKRTDSTGDWYVWDSARGIVAGNDPYLLLNSTAAEVTNTDYVDTYSAGFEISSTAPAAINASGGTFIFLAIA